MRKLKNNVMNNHVSMFDVNIYIYICTIVIYIVGNKYDLFQFEVVEEDVAKQYATDNQIGFKYVSALNGKNTNELFQEIADKYMSKGKQNNSKDNQSNQKLHNKKPHKKKCC